MSNWTQIVWSPEWPAADGIDVLWTSDLHSHNSSFLTCEDLFGLADKDTIPSDSTVKPLAWLYILLELSKKKHFL